MVTFPVARAPSLERPVVPLRNGPIVLVFRALGRRMGYGRHVPTALVSVAPIGRNDRTRRCLSGWVPVRGHDWGVKPLVESHGGTWTTEVNTNGPTTYRVSGVLPGTLRSIIDSIAGDGSTDWQFSDRPDQSIANSLPPLWDAVGAGREVDIPSSAEYFDVGTTRWSPGPVSGPDGLYRTNSFPRIYYLKVKGVCRQVSYRSGKHLAGTYHRRVLLAYETPDEPSGMPIRRPVAWPVRTRGRLE